MSNVTVRAGGIISHTFTEEQFVALASQIYGEGKTLDEYIKIYNASPEAKRDMIAVHREVPDEVAQHVAKKIKSDNTLEDYLGAAEKNLSDAVGHPVTIEFADDE